MNQQELPDIALVVNSPAPYRMHVLRRLRDELPQVRVHNIFTHNLERADVADWRFEMEESLRPVFFKKYSLRDRSSVSPVCLGAYRRIRDYLVEHNIRMVLLHGYNDLTRWLLICWAKRAGVPLLLTSDSNVFSEGRLPLLRRVIKRLYLRWVVRSVSGLMPMGSCGRAYWRMYVDHDKPTFLFPYEPDYKRLEKVDAQEKARFGSKHGFSADRRRLLYCGRLIAVKRVDVLIDAFVEVADQRPKWDLVLVGGGELRAALAGRVPQRLKSRVKFMGFIPADQTIACYHHCDVLVLPSDYEPWAVVINEAVACGLAVIATEVVGAAAELVRDKVNGRLVRPRDQAGLAGAILDVTAPGRCEQMQAEAAGVLKDWRCAADPVEGLAEAMAYFGVIPSVDGKSR